jgi:predicted HTH transcriptional regulator
MDEQELQLILEGRGQKIEFKESLANLDRLVAFANSCGGRIFSGITDGREIKEHGSPIGSSHRFRRRQQLRSTGRYQAGSFRDILIINVKEGETSPTSAVPGLRGWPYAQAQPQRDHRVLQGERRSSSTICSILI